MERDSPRPHLGEHRFLRLLHERKGHRHHPLCGGRKHCCCWRTFVLEVSSTEKRCECRKICARPDRMVLCVPPACAWHRGVCLDHQSILSQEVLSCWNLQVSLETPRSGPLSALLSLASSSS